MTSLLCLAAICALSVSNAFAGIGPMENLGPGCPPQGLPSCGPANSCMTNSAGAIAAGAIATEKDNGSVILNSWYWYCNATCQEARTYVDNNYTVPGTNSGLNQGELVTLEADAANNAAQACENTINAAGR